MQSIGIIVIKSRETMTAFEILFITMIPIYCKTTIFPYTCLFTFFGNSYNISKLTSAASKERLTTKIIFAVATAINYSYVSKLRIRLCSPPLHSVTYREEHEKYFFLPL